LHDAAESVHFACGQGYENCDGADNIADGDKCSSGEKGAGEVFSRVVNFVAEK
jgi:hypothetical protein